MRYATLWLALIAVLSLTPGIARAQSCDDLVFSVDVPSTFAGTTVQAYQAIECKRDVYQTSALWFNGQGLTSKTNVVSMTILGNYKKAFLFTTDAAYTVSSTYCPVAPCTFVPRDIVLAECVSGPGCTTDVPGSPTWHYSQYKIGTSLGLPSSAVIDGLAQDSDGKLLMSFDAPVTVNQYGGGTLTVHPADVVKLASEEPARYQLVMSADAEGMDEGTNVNGLDVTDDHYILMFDAPGTIGAYAFKTGWAYTRSRHGAEPTGEYYSDGGFPPGSIGTDFSLLPSPAIAPSDRLDGTPNVQMTKAGGSNLTISWQGPQAPCGLGITGYGIYEGTGTTFTNHIPATLSPSGQACNISSPRTIIPNAANLTWYLIVPMNSEYEGSYGLDSAGAERPQSLSPCGGRERKSSYCGTP